MRLSDPLDAESVAEGFRLILRRRPESHEVVAHYLSLGLTVGAFLEVLLDSEEYRERQRRLTARGDLSLDEAPTPRPALPRALLFGAYGNGNVGDMAQADAVASLLRDIAPGPIHVVASSWERRAGFASPSVVPLRPDALLRPEHVRPRTASTDGGGSDLIVIGGGGLLGAPHFPLHDQVWARWFVGRGVPFALLGLGGSAEALAIPEWRDAYTLLLNHAAFVGLRDAETLEAARAIRPDAAWFPDPVLAAAARAGGAAAASKDRPPRVVLIPRAPNGEADRVALQGLLQLASTAGAAGFDVVVAALEPAADAGWAAAADGRLITTWAALIDLCAGARFVISARLHGVVAGLAAGCAVIGLAQPKTGDLMQRLGVSDWFSAAGFPSQTPDLSAAAAARFHAALAPGWSAMAQDIDTALLAASRALRPILTRQWRA